MYEWIVGIVHDISCRLVSCNVKVGCWDMSIDRVDNQVMKYYNQLYKKSTTNISS